MAVMREVLLMLPGVTGRRAESMDAGVMERISGCWGLIARSMEPIVLVRGIGGGCCAPPGYADGVLREGSLCAVGLDVAARTGTAIPAGPGIAKPCELAV